MNFTEEQRLAIFAACDEPSIVSAAAGSGKTAVLVERVIYLITKEKPVSADRLVIVTFTEKAAAELRQRLEERLAALLDEQPENTLLAEQQVKLRDAYVSTISSFCLALLHENQELLPFDGGFTICDETTAKLLKQKAFETVMSRVYNSPPEKRGEAARIIGGESDIQSALYGLFEFSSNLSDRDAFFAEQQAIYASPDRYGSAFVKPLEKRAADLLDKAAEIMQSARNELCGGAYGTKAGEYANGYIDALLLIKAGLLGDENEKVLEALSRLKKMRIPSPSKNEDVGDIHEGFKSSRDKAKKLLDEVLPFIDTISSAESDRLLCKREIELLTELCGVFSAEYSRLKQERNYADFSDLEQTLLKILRSGEGRKKRLSDSFDYIIVDEFQDSNDVQYEIFRLLSQNEKNLYFVGDMKQCIYSFRSANPFVFAALLGKYNALLMNMNFRSSDSVIDCVNRIFGGEMPEAFNGGVWENMEGGRKILADENNISELVLLNLDKESDETAAQREAAYVAGKIAEMLDGGFPVTRKNGEKTPCKSGDFAILLRNDAGRGKIFREALKKRGIPAVTKGEKNFTDLSETNHVLSLLRVIENPYDDFALTSVMMSPLYLFSAEEMAQLRLSEAEKTENGYMGKTDLFSGAAELSKRKSPLGQKLSAFLSEIKLLRKIAFDRSLPQLLRYIYANTELLAMENVGFRGGEKMMNLHLLEGYAESFAKTGSRIGEFVEFMERVRRGKLEMPQANGSEQDESSVKILTMHGSKGLQFPIVFICCTNGKSDSRDTSKPFVFDISTGIGAMVNDFSKPARFASVSHERVGAASEEKRYGEELRLLYVAMTRAEEKLIITAAAKIGKDGDEAAEPSASGGSHFEFLWEKLAEIADTSSFIRFSRIASDISFEAPAQETAAEAADAFTDEKAVIENLSFKYKYEKQTAAPAKLTATQLGVLRDVMDETTLDNAFYMGLPLFMKNRRNVTPKEKGDIYHKVMQFLDFSAENAENELSRLENDGILTADERLVVKPSEIQAFLSSGLGKRAAKSMSVSREFPIFTLVNAAEIENPDDDDLSFVQGIADMFFEEGGEIVLVDYKTNSNRQEQELADEYRGQLDIYKKAITEMTGKKVKQCLLFSFSLKKEIAMDL